MAERKEKTVLITGASSGMGKTTAEALLKEGYTVYAAARRVDLMDGLKAAGGIPLKMDLTNEGDTEAVVERIRKDRGSIDILINNAGFPLYGSIEETAIADARYQFDVNLFGMARLTQLALPYMREKGEGRIICVGSGAGVCAVPIGAWYSASKFAIEGWVDSLRFELEPLGIDVVLIQPGAIKTEFLVSWIGPAKKRSGSGPYADTLNAMANWCQGLYDQPNGSSPTTVIADAISHAVRAKRPKTRYAVGKQVRLSIFLRKLMSDRVWDRQLRSLVK